MDRSKNDGTSICQKCFLVCFCYLKVSMGELLMNENWLDLSWQLRTGDYLITLLRGALYGTACPEPPANVSWKQIYTLAKMHSVECFAFEAAKEQLAQADPVLFKKWSVQSSQGMVQRLHQIEAKKEIECRFEQAQIQTVLVKGIELCDLYPKVYHRQMSDLDFLVREEALEKADKLMLQMGYQLSEENHPGDFHIAYHKPPYVTVELHRQLLPSGNSRAIYFEDVWEKVKTDPASPYIGRISQEYSYLFVAAHLAKHYYSSGSGIRSILDLYLLRKKYQKSMDWEFIHSQLKRQKLKKFIDAALQLGEDWFGKEERVFHHGKMRRMEQRIYVSGTHGSRLARLAGILPEDWEERSQLSLMAAVLIGRTFMPVQFMEQDYPVLQRFPVLLPVYWVRRIFAQLIFNRKRIRQELGSVKHTAAEKLSVINQQTR